MKKNNTLWSCLMAFVVIITFAGCKKESTPTVTLNETIDAAKSSPASNDGSFGSGPYGTVTGTARIFLTGDRYQLALENFSTSNGPDLKVYISNEKDPVH